MGQLFICVFLSRVIIFQGWICAYTIQRGGGCWVDESVLLNCDVIAWGVCRVADGLRIQQPRQIYHVVFIYDYLTQSKKFKCT